MSTCCGRARCRNCSTGRGPPRRWAAGCGRCAGGMSASSTRSPGRCWSRRGGLAPARPPGRDVTVDLDSTICEVYGLAKQGAARGYTGVRGYHPLLASCAGDTAGGGATQLLHTRLRGGNAGSGRGAGSFVTEVLARLHDALPADRAGRQGTVTLRADSGFYSRKVIRACRRGDARFSVTVRMNPSVRRAIAAIPEQAWTPIPYWSSEGTFGHDKDGTPISGADVADTA